MKSLNLLQIFSVSDSNEFVFSFLYSFLRQNMYIHMHMRLNTNAGAYTRIHATRLTIIFFVSFFIFLAKDLVFFLRRALAERKKNKLRKRKKKGKRERDREKNGVAKWMVEVLFNQIHI